ncbi:hypothetical protein TPHA_0F00920 [Tetrapisispora phaffii CBS 4417]|uniref:Transcriptional regulatory protein n=1 Tax=Tetrapisispora phaffii (strain ATCC 24235 / CBS 4417 / NBRC 1672 / NRRL Y-8282 / UCD 70-5) TaxID=1071381 RepID=G8BUZ6_TETPH|nr:hypothetical protein TPHA_0F00920 [Tetrapisispora phaffii CBS 4417]CCE63578.1 hypothetical protein TPHA_0F00920 [Tetrapisispora phaffii CBS 4417]
MLRAVPKQSRCLVQERPQCCSLITTNANSKRSFNCGMNPTLSGHNKWSTIKHDKAKNDAEKNKLFSKFANQIQLAVKLGGGSTDPTLNIRLATAMEAANKNNVSKKVVDNAIKKAAGISLNKGSVMETCLYEGMGPGGVAFVIEALTDNRNRTFGFVRSAFTKVNGSMTPTLYFFDKKGYAIVRAPIKYENDEDKILERVLDIKGVEDLEQIKDEEEASVTDEPGNSSDNSDKLALYSIRTEPSSTNAVAAELKQDGFKIEELAIGYFGKDDLQVTLPDEESKAKFDRFMDTLDSIDEITAIHTNIRD